MQMSHQMSRTLHLIAFSAVCGFFPGRTIHLQAGADAHFTLIYLMYSDPRLADSHGASRPALRKHHLARG